MRDRHAAMYLLPAILALAGPAVLVVATSGGFLPFALGWWAVSVLVALISNRAARMGVAAVLIPVCVVTVFEGGLFMLPAVISLLVIDATTTPERPTFTAA